MTNFSKGNITCDIVVLPHGGIGDSPWLFICEETWWLQPNGLATTLKVHNNNSPYDYGHVVNACDEIHENMAMLSFC